jgi:hypothetical protein
MIPDEEIPLFERVLGISLALMCLIILLFAMAILVEKYLLCKEEKMTYSLLPNDCR